jgi:hypothetical protein
MCAEGEVGAKVRRLAGAKDRDRPAEPAASSGAAAAAPRRRRRRRPAGSNGPLPLPETPAIAAPPASAVKQERTSSAPRRRRRRRPASSTGAARDGEPVAATPATPEPPAAAPARSGSAERGGLSGVIRRLRRT